MAGLVAVPPATQASAEATADFDEHWRRALAELVTLPPDALPANALATVRFPVTATGAACAVWLPGSDPWATPVVHVVEALGEPRPSDRTRSHFYLPWRQDDRPLDEWLREADDPLDGAPALAVLAACQAVYLVRSCPHVRATGVGLVGDGPGAQIALAAAALVPDRVAWLILHQPTPAFYRLADGTLTACPTVRPALDTLACDGPWYVAQLAYLEPRHFAARLRSPAFVIAGAADREAPAGESELLFAALAGPRDGLIFQGVGHWASDRLPGFAAMLDRVDAFAAARRLGRLTSP
ncbi:MAG: alpha/beta hydrolase family protein [Armatimonadota bacterium]